VLGYDVIYDSMITSVRLWRYLWFNDN